MLSNTSIVSFDGEALNSVCPSVPVPSLCQLKLIQDPEQKLVALSAFYIMQATGLPAFSQQQLEDVLGCSVEILDFPFLCLWENQLSVDWSKVAEFGSAPKKITKGLMDSHVLPAYNEYAPEAWPRCRKSNDARIKYADRLYQDCKRNIDTVVIVIKICGAYAKLDPWFSGQQSGRSGNCYKGSFPTMFRDRRYQDWVDWMRDRGVNADAIHSCNLSDAHAQLAIKEVSSAQAAHDHLVAMGLL